MTGVDEAHQARRRGLAVVVALGCGGLFTAAVSRAASRAASVAASVAGSAAASTAASGPWPRDGTGSPSRQSSGPGWASRSSPGPGPEPTYDRDLNRATRAEIESARGVGVEMADRILHAREQRPFDDWADLRRRVKRVSRRVLEGLHEAGFLLAGQPPPLPDAPGHPKKALTSGSRAFASA